MAEAEGPEGPEAEALILLPGMTHGFVSKLLTEGLPGGPGGGPKWGPISSTPLRVRDRPRRPIFSPDLRGWGAHGYDSFCWRSLDLGEPEQKWYPPLGWAGWLGWLAGWAGWAGLRCLYIYIYSLRIYITLQSNLSTLQSNLCSLSTLQSSLSTL